MEQTGGKVGWHEPLEPRSPDPARGPPAPCHAAASGSPAEQREATHSPSYFLFTAKGAAGTKEERGAGPPTRGLQWGRPGPCPTPCAPGRGVLTLRLSSLADHGGLSQECTAGLRKGISPHNQMEGGIIY